MRRILPLLLAGALTVTPVAAGAPAPGPTFSGSCQFKGTIHPEPPITVVPRLAPRFSYDGSGVCSGTAAGRALRTGSVRVRFRHARTPLDSCELGLDLELRGTMTLRVRRRTIAFSITVDLLRAAVVAPLRLTATRGGTGAGVAQFTPDSPTGAARACASAGVASATLSGSFSTVQPLVGEFAR